MSPGVSACLQASFENYGGRTRSTQRTEAPLELRGPFERNSAPSLFYLRNTTAGVFAGDKYEINVCAQSGAHIQIASSSAAKVYAMQEGAASRVRLEAGPGSRIFWGPHATILQQGADFVQETVAVLNDGSLFLAEVLVFGRLGSGERHRFGRFGNSLKVMQASGCPLYEERYELRGEDDRALNDALGGHGALASFYGLGADALLAPYKRLACQPDVFDALSVLPNDCGFVTRALADSLSQALSFVEAAMAVCRTVDLQRFAESGFEARRI